MDTVQQARKLLESSEAAKCLELALPVLDSQSSDDVKLEALHLIGEAYLENGDPKNAFECFSKCAELDPDGSKGGMEKFLWLGQLSGGEPGLKWFEKGLHGLRNALTEVNNKAASSSKVNGDNDLQMQFQVKLLHKKINEALCGMIEVWMTDLCMEPEAESQCEKLIAEALLLDEEIPESWSMLGSIRISQQRNDDAREALERSWQLFQAVGDGSIDELPSLIRLAQNMMEMGQHQYVLDVTKRIHVMDDQVVDSFYLNGLAHNELYKEIRDGPDAESKSRIAARHIAGARDAWTLLLNLTNTGDVEVDDELVSSVQELLTTLPEVGDDDFSSSSEEEDEDMEDDDDKVDLKDLDSDEEL
ncbi:hypothetical protein AWJ20_4761 [Sugiyamaella lignohabitans]|uniref:Uncharacterized protein n=1 Tax=Sugiyamaella lignohabitans TaxID=796027 RepID=A0A167E9R5_9ASCO|nr:uncharacterized protein AWJ20_4761 [Sugiyamaella lignohabitans]ANB13814.1 hypothetical protein AWJ20_4761 [Sugiyamaella lignohabitans]